MIISDLPRDLFEEILCRVPATSLKRLRPSCKRWNSLFHDRRFTRKQFDKAAKQFLILMLKQSRVCSMSVNLHGLPSVEVTGELSLVDPLSSSYDPFEINQVSHCDGLLLCTKDYNTRIVVWNPCTGQTRWIQPCNGCNYYAFGSYQDNKSHDHSYKILGYGGGFNNNELAVCDINSNSWRTLDITSDRLLQYADYGVSHKGNTYWFASDEEEEKQLGMFLISFDYTTERFGRLHLPYQCPRYETVSLSVASKDKLSVLLQREDTSRTEIWVANQIGETKVVSWSMVLAVDMKPKLNMLDGISFLVDEEKKVLVCCDKYFGKDELEGKTLVHIVGEDNEVTQVDFGEVESAWPFLFNYVPSLIQIQQAGVVGKRKRDE
ncbi:unnamed protein product [Microthlaspi erraticum]|uniref:F-box domain-containing protein n=1 Tax=Microthlaspi erraticum TaxID=1685480 RepID=A0A6D2LIZ1_9BRAS|nr:unnamed protein product [Microthlaspi erraticum]